MLQSKVLVLNRSAAGKVARWSPAVDFGANGHPTDQARTAASSVWPHSDRLRHSSRLSAAGLDSRHPGCADCNTGECRAVLNVCFSFHSSLIRRFVDFVLHLKCT